MWRISRYWLTITVSAGAMTNLISEYEFIIVGKPHAAALRSGLARLNAASCRIRFQPSSFHGASKPRNLGAALTCPAILPSMPSAPTPRSTTRARRGSFGSHDASAA
jgi:hypothetical protein